MSSCTTHRCESQHYSQRSHFRWFRPEGGTSICASPVMRVAVTGGCSNRRMRSIPFLTWDGCRITLGVCGVVIPSSVPCDVRAAVPLAARQSVGTRPAGRRVRADLEPRVPRLQVTPEGRDLQLMLL
jgi:hypothetical protein